MKKFMILIVAFLLAVPAWGADGLVEVISPDSVRATADRLVKVIQEKGLLLVADLDHQKNAQGVGLELRPTRLIIFGNPNIGTPLMNCGQTVAIDLPQKILVWEDEQGQVRVGYNDPAYLAKRHGLENCEGVLDKINVALQGLARAAVTP